jgi:hypothetical protein
MTPPQITYAAFLYVATLLANMILIASIVPNADPDSFDIPQILVKGLISLVDLLGLHILLSAKRSSSGVPIVTGLTWAVTESVTQRLVPLWVEARSMQFSWKHTITSLEANISIATHVVLALLVWLWTRRPALRPTIVVRTPHGATHHRAAPAAAQSRATAPASHPPPRGARRLRRSRNASRSRSCPVSSASPHFQTPPPSRCAPRPGTPAAPAGQLTRTRRVRLVRGEGRGVSD